MKIIDSHTHLMDELYNDDLNDVINRCKENDIEYLINVGFDKSSSYKAVELAEKYDWMYATIGMHPDECNIENVEIDYLKELSQNKNVVAIGEIGLDYHYEETNRINQQEGFRRQIELANEIGLPVVIHSRDADMDMLNILKSIKIEKGFVMHCFSSSVEIANEVLKLGGYISVAGTVTFKNAKQIKEVVKIVPIDKLFVETDAPYLTPEPCRGQRNEPWRVWETAKAIAELKSIFLDELVSSVNNNIKHFYGI